MMRFVILSAAAVAAGVAVRDVPADDPQPAAVPAAANEDAPAAERPAQKAIRELATAEVVRVADDSPDGLRPAELRPEPVLTYGDDTRQIGESALWVWFDRDHPVLFEKIEVNNWSATYPQWTFCLSSFAESPLHIALEGEVRLPAWTANPAAFAAVPNSPAAGASAVTWPLEARELSRGFSVETYAGKKRTELRLMPKPLVEYTAQVDGIAYGAMFGYARGTNPDVLVLLRLKRRADGGREWSYAVSPMTAERVVVGYEGQTVAEPATQKSGQMTTWGFLYTRRSPSVQ